LLHAGTYEVILAVELVEFDTTRIICVFQATPCLPFGSTGADLVASSSYSNSAPSGYSVWGVGKHDNQQQKPSTQPVLPGVKVSVIL
jgi:hypothetical protein